MYKNKYCPAFLLVFLIIFTAFALNAKAVNIITFNNFHGRLVHNESNFKYAPGINGFIIAIQKEVKNSKGGSIVVSAGNNYQGTCISVLTKGAPVNDMFKEIQLKASAVGNHEFDWGQKYFSIWEKEGDFEFLACNIINDHTGKPVVWAKPYIIENVKGIKIAFIGIATPDTVKTTSMDHIRDLTFKNPIQLTQYWINFLKSGKAPEGKPDAIIALTHLDCTQVKIFGEIKGKLINDLCKKTKGLDAVITADPVCGYINKIPIVQGEPFGESLGILQLKFNQKRQLLTIIPELSKVHFLKKVKGKQYAGTMILKKYESITGKYSKVIGKTESDLKAYSDSVSPLGGWLAKQVKDRFNVQVAIINSGSLRNNLYKGKITLAEVFDVMPFTDSITTMKIKGSELKKIIEHGILSPDNGFGQFYGLNIMYKPQNKYGNRILSIKLNSGQQIQDKNYYSIAVTGFMYTGGDGYSFKGAEDVKQTKVELRDVMIDSIKTHAIIKPIELNYFTKK